MLNMKITMIDQDVKNGARYNCRKCPIALAVKRQIDGQDTVYVEEGEVRIESYKGFGTIESKMPQIAKNFINAFDDGDLPEPISFVLKFKRL